MSFLDEMASQVFSAVEQSKVEPTTMSFNPANTACEKGGVWQSALQLFDVLGCSRCVLGRITF